MGIAPLLRLDQTNVGALAKGMASGLSGVSAPPIRRIGAVVAGSGNGSFSSNGFGFGEHGGDSSGRYYVADPGNNRVQQFDADGSFLASRTATQLLGSSLAIHLLAIQGDEIHIGAGEATATGTHVSVWPLSLGFSNLSTSNWTRQYGSNGSVGSGITTSARALTLFGDLAVIVSSSGARKVVIRNHTTNALVAELDWSGGAYRFAVANGKLYGGGVASTGTSPGLREISTALASVTRLDPAASFADGRWGVISVASSTLKVQDAIGYNNKIYLREHSTGRIVAWDAVTGLFSDVYLRTDGEPSDTLSVGGLGGTPNATGAALVYGGKMGVLFGHTAGHADYLFHWAANVGGGNALSDQLFLSGIPLSVATAAWSLTGWGAGVSTLKRLVPFGDNLASEKIRLRLRKNGGAWQTVLFGQLHREDLFALVGTLTGSDVLDVEAAASGWDRLDGHAVLKATRDKLPVTNLGFDLVYDNTLADVYVPYATGALRGRLGGQGAFRGRLGA